jgi:hypothetical protein
MVLEGPCVVLSLKSEEYSLFCWLLDDCCVLVWPPSGAVGWLLAGGVFWVVNGWEFEALFPDMDLVTLARIPSMRLY